MAGWLAGWQSSTRGISQIQQQAKEEKKLNKIEKNTNSCTSIC
jgi:hypothetical protein